MHRLKCKLHNNHKLLNTIGLILVLVIIFFILERKPLPDHFQSFFSILITGGIVYALYLSVQKKKVQEALFILLSGLLVIINRLYDPLIFRQYFSFPLKYGVIIVSIIYSLRIVFFSILKIFRPSVHTDDTVDMSDSLVPKEQQNDISQTRQVATDTKTDFIASRDHLPQPVNSSSKSISAIKVSLGETFIAITMLVMSLLLSFIFMRRITRFQNLTSDQIITNFNSFIPIILIYLLSTIIVFIMLCTYGKLIKVMIDILRGNDAPIIYIIGIMVISVFLTKTGYFNQDRMLDLFTQGDIFSFPIATLIIYPVFLLSTHTIKQLLDDHKVSYKILDKTRILSKRVLKIGYSIINSSITFIEFVSSDFLTNLIQIIETDDEEEI